MSTVTLQVKQMLADEPQISFEDIVGTATEKEFEFYGKVPDSALLLHELKSADHAETQEQWKVDNVCEDCKVGKTRVRKSHPLNRERQAKFHLTSKLNIAGSRAQEELTTEVDREFFEHFKKCCATGLRKDRFSFATGDGLVWEVDVFYDRNGQPINWVKLDLEVADMRRKVPPFPLSFITAVVDQPGKRSEGDDRLVEQLYEDKFISYNPRFRNASQ